MKVIRFEIENFKGISQTSINLSDEIPGNVITLIGLNESGKTTILEAISHFFTEDTEAATFVKTVHQKSSLQELIPKDRKAAFTGDIRIQACIQLDAEDLNNLSKHFLEKHSLILDEKNMQRDINLAQSYSFVDSAFQKTNNYWSVYFPLKTKSERKYRPYASSDETRPVWLDGVNYIRPALPRIVYFPTFLFNFPERIYLKEGVAETNSYYRQIMQDVLDSQGEGLSVKKHIEDRIEAKKSSAPNPLAFFAYLLGLDEKSQIDAVTQKISNEMSRVIFGAWGEILGRPVTDKRVQVGWFIDSEKNNAPYLEVSIIDGQSKYALSERSLGFRWFFSFLLFTQFRRSRRDDSATIFLFDEPAANLHSKAQIKLLESFTRIAKGQTYIIYSTHSHYMVNPMWLEKAYIVENKAVDFEDNEEVNSFAVRKTDIRATKYRAFVAAHPTKTTYFQPVLDALDVSFSPLEPTATALIVEGKFDFHPFIYLRDRLGRAGFVNVFPASGAESMGLLINLFRGRGVEFCILLDDDSAGRAAKARYMKEFLLSEKLVATLGEISNELKGKAFDEIFQSDVRAAAKKCFSSEKITKRQHSLYFQELIATGANTEFPETEKAFRPIYEWGAKLLAAR
jgi:predicted ATPase